MPKDNLTLKLKEQLASQGFAATDQEIDNYLKSLKQPQQSATAMQRPDWLTGNQTSESKINLIEGVGATAWGLLDTALFSLPGIAARQAGLEKIDIPFTDTDIRLDPQERGPAGKVGGIFGEAAGFLLPMKWISKGVGYGVKSFSKLGGKRLTDELVKGTGRYRGDESIYNKAKELGFKDESALQ